MPVLRRVKVRIVNPHPLSMGMGYTKGSIHEVSPDQAEAWTRTRFAELVTDKPAPAAASATPAPTPAFTRRRAH